MRLLSGNLEPLQNLGWDSNRTVNVRESLAGGCGVMLTWTGHSLGWKRIQGFSKQFDFNSSSIITNMWLLFCFCLDCQGVLNDRQSTRICWDPPLSHPQHMYSIVISTFSSFCCAALCYDMRLVIWALSPFWGKLGRNNTVSSLTLTGWAVPRTGVLFTLPHFSIKRLADFLG